MALTTDDGFDENMNPGVGVAVTTESEALDGDMKDVDDDADGAEKMEGIEGGGAPESGEGDSGVAVEEEEDDGDGDESSLDGDRDRGQDLDSPITRRPGIDMERHISLHEPRTLKQKLKAGAKWRR